MTSKTISRRVIACARWPMDSARCPYSSKTAKWFKSAGRVTAASSVWSNSEMASACSIKVRGIVQGVGFRPFVFRLAQANTLAGWVLNGDQGVEIHLEGAERDMASFVEEMQSKHPAASIISEIEVEPAPFEDLNEFT